MSFKLVCSALMAILIIIASIVMFMTFPKSPAFTILAFTSPVIMALLAPINKVRLFYCAAIVVFLINMALLATADKQDDGLNKTIAKAISKVMEK